MMINVTPKKWVRSSQGWIGGVCQGLGERFGVEPNLVRLLWAVSVLAFGIGILPYIVLVFTLPKEDQLIEADQPKVLGVCHRLAQKFNIEVGLVRASAVLIGLGSLGTAVLVYFVLFFVLPETNKDILVS